MKLSKRAETNDRTKLVATFVDDGPLFTLLSTRDHQVLYGRRGTGKTHALAYIADIALKRGDSSVYLDLRTIGSTGGLYADTTVPLPTRATTLLVDTLLAMHSQLFEYFVDRAEELDLSTTGPILDRLADAASHVTVTGRTELETKTSESISESEILQSGFGLTKASFSADLTLKEEVSDKRQSESRVRESGVASYNVQFGTVGQVFRELIGAMADKRILLLLDEWSSIPLELQPYLADLLRRSIFPVQNITVKIAAIEQRSRFRIPTSSGDYIGLELGSDVSADLNLDDFMVFDNDAGRAKEFFKNLLFKHLRETDEIDLDTLPNSPDELIRIGFSQFGTFDEYVRAAEGVPRDAINIIAVAAQRAFGQQIAMNHITTAARDWYQRDKEATVRADDDAHALLHWIIDKVIGERRARAFLLKSDSNHSLINILFDHRVLHVMKRNISSHDQPGVRYDVYKLDYGCYVDLRSTAKAPLGLLQAEDPSGDHTYVEVPPDDYRAIRRAILDLDEFLKRPPTLDLG